MNTNIENQKWVPRGCIQILYKYSYTYTRVYILVALKLFTYLTFITKANEVVLKIGKYEVAQYTI